jgi:hypothetical protein
MLRKLFVEQLELDKAQLFYYLKGMWRKLFVEQLELDTAAVLLPEGNVEETVRRAAGI